MDKQAKTAFSWGWESHEPTADPLMTRRRMARLMRAWRRQPLNASVAMTGRAFGRRTYRVAHIPTGETATFIVATAHD